ncbi:hypothetical protein H6G97_34685 [Nostoc flagelliforme FACHB-838]|uniref:Uncharacterized protein n=1 Tax=Nostoc flagelliforme FACHB-838 TaxID=2692904 RepID=A0ABR8DYI0_9NOSO|nr:hypothetical protein [Nostoc flagelliforme]MBD2534385.1 hypothetical protein [Nostoc flagelliforme FACHB-838]
MQQTEGRFLVLVRQPHRQKTTLDGAVLLEPRAGVIGQSPPQIRHHYEGASTI